MTIPLYGGFPFSMFDPVHLGVDENGEHVYVNLAERNMLLGGEPGAGKSSGLNLIVAHGALSHDCKLILVDGKQVELGLWRDCADMFIGPSIKDAIAAFEAFQATMNTRYDDLTAAGRRKITRESGECVYLIVIDLCRARDYADVVFSSADPGDGGRSVVGIVAGLAMITGCRGMRVSCRRDGICLGAR